MISRTTNKRGFTLIELLAVIVIMALIAVIGFPALKAMSGSALQAGSRQFSNALMLGRQYAINNRAPVRVVLAVNATNMGSGSSNWICRAYGVYWSSNDVNGVTVAWWPLQDWRTLPTGVVFSDHTASSYNVVTPNPPPPLGSQPRTAGAGSGFSFDNSTSMPLVTNISSGASASITASYVEFRPTGAAKCITTPPQGAAGIRLALGTVTIPVPYPPTVVINSTNNWVYVEYDTQNGRVRIRYPESYQ